MALNRTREVTGSIYTTAFNRTREVTESIYTMALIMTREVTETINTMALNKAREGGNLVDILYSDVQFFHLFILYTEKKQKFNLIHHSNPYHDSFLVIKVWDDMCSMPL